MANRARWLVRLRRRLVKSAAVLVKLAGLDGSGDPGRWNEMSGTDRVTASRNRPSEKRSFVIFEQRRRRVVLSLAIGFVFGHGSSMVAQNPPPERVVLPEQEPEDRTTDAPEAPIVVDACSSDAIVGYELPSIGRAYQRETVGFSLQVRDEVIPYRLMSISTLPDEPVEIEVVLGHRGKQYNACASGGELIRLDSDEWVWWPEKPGIQSVYVTEGDTKEIIKLQMLVLEPYSGEDVFHGYRVGKYEAISLRGNPKYEMPPGLLRVTPDMLDLWLSPHFQLRQFLCKQESDFPRFILVHSRMLSKLELLLEKVNAAGIEASSFAVLSGYRTPHYNRAIGNKTRYSRHVYGDAADIYIDRDGDGHMDDITGDGRVTRKDAEKLASIIEDSYDRIWYKPFIGGLGIYGPKPHRGPFVHVDTRGSRARW